MSEVNTVLNVTELDFDQIKSNIKNYFKNTDSVFKDWDYEGSGLNQLLDVLAYNTHYNAFTAHMALNESFISSAQIRSNVVSSAKLVGYVPKSAGAAVSVVDVTFKVTGGVSTPPSSITLDRGSFFKAILGGRTYSFINLQEYTILKDATTSTYTLKNLELHQASLTLKTFQVNNLTERPTYQIDDDAIDLNHLVVRVYDSITKQNSDVYTRYDDSSIGRVTKDSKIYFVNENYNGKYEISFGNNIFGKQPGNLSIIEIDYILTDGADANGISLFTYAGSVPDNIDPNPTITTVSKSYGGTGKESIDSIRYNAPTSFVTQNRAVTADDYGNLIKSKISDVDSISVWGGEDNDPPQYGKVFMCVKIKDKTTPLDDSQKSKILDVIKYKKVLTISPQLVEAEYININLDVYFKYNNTKTNLTGSQLESNVRDVVSAYNETNLQSFNKVFRHSQLSNRIDNSNKAILNSLVRVFVTQSFTVDPQNPQKTTIYFNVPLTIDENSKAIINCSLFKVKNNNTFLGDTAIEGTTNLRRVYTYRLNLDGGIQIIDTNAGVITLNTGKIELNEFYVDDVTEIVLDMLPASNDIAPNRNQLLKIDTNRIIINGQIDTIEIGGPSRSINYTTFKRER